MLIPILTLSILGLLFGLGLAFTFKIFKVETDPKIAQILKLLPGANCGACGFGGCLAFAEALAKGKAGVELCAPGKEEVQQKIAEVLGVEIREKTKMVATLICNGGTKARDKCDYKGIATCEAANIYFGGQKTCPFGCLGFGDCVGVCPFGAIHMGRDKLPIIDENICRGCQRCVAVCPKKILVMRPIKNRVYVKCNSSDKGGIVAKYCKAGCIGCVKCEKVCPCEAIQVSGNLALIDYSKCSNCAECVKVCPTKVIYLQNFPA